MTRRLGALLLVGMALAGCTPGDAVTAEEPLLVAGAADLMPAFTQLGEAFEDATGEQVTFSFGSSGQLAQQILEGAPMDLFASADVAYVDDVVDAGQGDPGTQATYAHGRLVLWASEQRWGGWDSLEDLADDGDAQLVAIANPAHAPYGKAARQALERRGLQQQMGSRLVYGENVADAHRLAATANADAAVVALSLALAADEEGQGRWLLLDEDLHEPLQQDLVVVADDDRRATLAAAFIDFVNGEQGRQVLRRYGFLLPGEDAPGAWEG